MAPVQEEEHRKQGSIGWRTYVKYFHAGASVLTLLVLLVINIIAQLAYIMSDWWLSYW